MKLVSLFTALMMGFAFSAQAETAEYDVNNFYNEQGEYDPEAPFIADYLDWNDQQVGNRPVELDPVFTLAKSAGLDCKRETCPLWADVDKSEQVLRLYAYGNLVNGDGWATSTGKGGTPDMETTINAARIYDEYMSKASPGGDYNGLGNMPYAVFIKYGKGGYAVHGTPKSNWKYLGKPASHGCVRVHPDNGYTFNRMVRPIASQFGSSGVWISIHK